MLEHCTGFQWDHGNRSKNLAGHGVTDSECEEVFFNEPFVRRGPQQKNEVRYFALGRTEAGRYLFVVFTVRKALIRVISARDMSESERRVYKSHGK